MLRFSRHTRQTGLLIWILEARWLPPAAIRMVSPGLQRSKTIWCSETQHMINRGMYRRYNFTNLAAATAVSMLGKTPGSVKSLTDRSTRSHSRGWHARYRHLWQTRAVLYRSASSMAICDRHWTNYVLYALRLTISLMKVWYKYCTWRFRNSHKNPFWCPSQSHSQER